MPRKIIGIPGFTQGEGSFGAPKTYLDFISRFGDPKIIMPWETEIACDVLLLPGGPDVSTSLYGQTPTYYTGNACIHRQGFYDRRLKQHIDAGVPIFGICLGMQMLNIYFGGSLIQHFRKHAQSRNRGEVAHYIHIVENDIYTYKKQKKDDQYEVNSHHHQGVTQLTLAESFNMLAYTWNYDDYDENNQVVEAITHKNLSISAVQWHPEEIHDDFAVLLFEQIVNAG